MTLAQILQQDESAANYEDFDYSQFWQGRAYEDMSDKMAVEYLLKKTSIPHEKIADVGSGAGRLAPIYTPLFEESILIDPSLTQLALARSKYGALPGVAFLQGTAEQLPTPEQSVDVIVCTRVFHYVHEPKLVFQEMKRVLKPNGYFILEIPNKMHAKVRLQNLIRGKRRNAILSASPVNIASESSDIFFNHHPATIANELIESGFTILEMLSVSNFRSATAKRLIPFKILVALERFLQRPLARLWFGPSIYFLAQLKTQKPDLRGSRVA